MVELQNSQNPTSPDEAKRKPAIRTMRSDVEELFKTTRPSLLQMIGQKNEAPFHGTAGNAWKPNRLIIISSAATLLVLTATIFWPTPQENKSLLVSKLIPPAPFFATETSRTLTIKIDNRTQFLRLISDAVKERERAGIIKRVLVKLQDTPQERFVVLSDFFNFWRIAPPDGFLQETLGPIMTFVYYGSDGGRFGLAVKIRDADRILRRLLDWEISMLRDLGPLFFDEKPDIVIAPFEDRTYRNIDWRFLKLSQTKDLGIGYTIFPSRNILVLTTSKEALETIINRLSEAR